MLCGHLVYMVEQAQLNEQEINAFSIYDWVLKHKVLKGDLNRRAVLWQLIRDYMVKNYNIYFPIETQRYGDMKDLVKEMKEKEKTNV